MNHIMEEKTPSLSRRQFLKVSVISGLGFSIGVWSDLGEAVHHGKNAFGHFVKIANDNTVTVIVKHLDKGQGVTTGLPAIVAEELDADWAQMRWEYAPADSSKYNNLSWGPYQGTGGSSSIANSWTQLRQAGAAAKNMLIQAAAEKWQVNAGEIKVAKGKVSHPSGKSASFGELAEAAASKAPPQEPKLKNPEEFTLIGVNGSAIARIDSYAKSTGKARYTMDVRRPGMLAATIVHPPVFGAVAKKIDDTAAKKIKGVKKIVSTPRGVAVVADNYWLATQGRKALGVEWDDSKAEKRSSEDLWKAIHERADTPADTVRSEGDVEKALKAGDKVVELEFEYPYLAHATMEPLNCVVEINKNRCDVWTGSQIPTVDQQVVASISGLAPEKVHIHTQFAGGSFGRRAVPDSDFVAEAAMIAKALPGTPISLQWSREDDMKGGRYRPMTYHKFRGAINKKGEITAWHQRAVSQSILRGTPFAGFITGPVDPVVTEGGATLPYKIPNLLVDAKEIEIGVPVLWWRSVGHTHNAYGTEVFLDELAHAAKRDPVELRLALLEGHPRLAAVVKLAAQRSGWGKKLPPNKAQGVAMHESFKSYVAQVAEVTLNQDGSYSVDKIVCAVDCGIAVTPDVIRAQMEGGIGYGLGAAMGERITLKKGQVEQNNFYDYFPMRIDQMPEIEVHIVASAEAPTGVGEPGTPPAAPAVANALRTLRGRAITQLPFGEKLSV